MSERIDMELAALFDERKDDGAQDLRRAAWADFMRRGLPNKRVESWHYTDMRAALKLAPEFFQETGAREAAPRKDQEWAEGVEAQTLRDALAQGDPAVMAALARNCDDPMVALNAALMEDGVVLRIAPGAVIDQLRLPAAKGEFTRTLILVGAQARVNLIEEKAGSETGAFQNEALLLNIGVNAHVTQATLVHSAGNAPRVLSLLVDLADGASLESYALIEGGGLLRRQVFASLNGEYARVSFNGATLARGRDHVDTTLVVDHRKAHGASRERFRNILDESATGVFQGKVIVRAGAQKTDGVMQSKAILLSDHATMNNKPELEIFADDVQCGHGATCGRLDKDQLFYLTSRGIPHDEAEALLIEGFANEAFEGLEDETLRSCLSERVSAWLKKRATA